MSPSASFLPFHGPPSHPACPQVRRAAAKVLAAVASAYGDAVGTVYSRTAGELVGRFREREENERADVFGAYVTLARQV